MAKKSWKFGLNEQKYVKEMLDSGLGSSTEGSMCQRFERLFAKKVGAKYGIAYNSGTGTLQAALNAVGVSAGDEVITAPLTVISNADVCFAQNAIPVFADIDKHTFNIDPKSVAEHITEKTKAIMPVSLYGLSADLDPLMKLAKKHGIAVVNDAAEAHMAIYNNKKIAECADITSYSLENSKHLTTGDGGIVVTDNEDYAISMRKFGSLGYAAMKSGDGRIKLNKETFQDPEYKRHDSFGYNFRMPEIAAALGLGQTERMEELIQLRIDISNLYLDIMKDCDYIVPQHTPEGSVNTYWTVAATLENPDIPWKEFRKKYVEYGGDGIFAAWALLYNETVVSSGAFKKRCPWVYKDINYKHGICPVAEEVQPKLMQFDNNYGSLKEAEPKVEALSKTIEYFRRKS